MKASIQKHVLFAILSLVLTACGGGSGSTLSSATSGGGARNGVQSLAEDQQGTSQITPAIVEPVTEVAAVRFLEQASFGATAASVARVRELGFSAYLDEQMVIPASGYIDPLEGDDVHDVKHQFFNNAINGPDQLRQRVAYALGQIFVVSAKDIGSVDAITSYQRMLLENTFGTYAKLLEEVTLHPAMGTYLNMVNNAAGESPNENYAREVMQLFSIGTVKLATDGTPMLDAQGVPIPTYGQEDVEGMARALTGWTYPVAPGGVSRNRNPSYYYGRMVAVDSLHDQGVKILLDSVVLPAGQPAAADISAALDVIASHPNVAPFIGFRLIQHLVTSNPSGAYVQRVAAVFNNNAHGVRGDMKAVVKAILLDEEARRGDDPQAAQSPDGRLKDPVLFVVGLLRSLGAVSTGTALPSYTSNMGLDVFAAPSVFNYYSPDYRIPGTDVLGPEFGIFISPYIVARDNFVITVVFGWATSLSVDLSAWAELAADTTRLVDAIDTQMFHGTMLDATRSIIANTLEGLPNADNLTRARTALYLATTSAEYSIHH